MIDPAATNDQTDPLAEIIAGLKAKRPDDHFEKLQTPGPDGPLVAIIRVPSESEWRIVKSMGADTDPVKRVASNRQLCNFCVLYPSGGELLALYKRYPVIIDTWAGEIAEASGAIKGTTREKL